jgi:hypothetical protein
MTVTIVANDNALLDLEQAKAFLHIRLDDQDDVIQDLINRASDFCEWWCGRPIKARAFADLRLPGQVGPVLRPPAVPIDITATLTLSIWGASQTIWKRESDGDPSAFDVIVGADVTDPRLRPNLFHRARGWCGGDPWGNPYPILLSYTGGFDPVPGELLDAAGLVLQHLYRLQEKQTADVTGLTSPVGGSVSYAPELVGSLIPMQAKQILDSYRTVSV